MITGNAAPGVPALIYHAILESDDAVRRTAVTAWHFDQQMKWLHQQGYHAASADEVCGFLRGGMDLPARSVIITFDDGYESAGRLAVPILRKYALRATFFVVTAKVGRRELLSWAQLRELVESGMSIGCHTATHARLVHLNRKRLKQELADSKAMLEGEVGRPCPLLAYPYGQYTGRVKQAAREAGYAAAFGNRWGLNYPVGDPYALKRMGIRQWTSLPRFSALVEGEGLMLHSLLQEGTALAAELIASTRLDRFGSIFSNESLHTPSGHGSAQPK